MTSFLQNKTNKSEGENTRTLYCFSKEKKEGIFGTVPAGYKVVETAKSLPVLKKI